jgi:hypothetical protein
MADNLYTCILNDLEKVSTVKSCAESKDFCAEIKEKIGVFKWKVSAYSKFTVDFNSQQFLFHSFPFSIFFTFLFTNAVCLARDHFFEIRDHFTEIC